MQALSIPQHIVWKPGTKPHEEHVGLVEISPCEPGYGITLGTALRRVLLSSLPGAAITAFKVEGALHEFTTLPHVKEDVVALVLALKGIRFNLHTDEEVRLTLSKKGVTEVTAGDFTPHAAVEVVNPGAHIATITSSEGSFDMEVVVRKGRGYMATEDRDREERELGTILVDALYSPVLNVGVNVDHVRVGEMTNFERLTLSVTTDGSVSPQDAYMQSVDILMQQLESLRGNVNNALESTEIVNEEPVLVEGLKPEEARDDTEEGTKKTKKVKSKKE